MFGASKKCRFATDDSQARQGFSMRKTATSDLLTLPSAAPTTRLVRASGSAAPIRGPEASFRVKSIS
jgi:hypothetical protein